MCQPNLVRATLRAVIHTSVIALVLAIPVPGAVAQTSECLALGPTKSPTWALMSEASRRAICARHDAAELRSVAAPETGPADVRSVATVHNGSLDARSVAAAQNGGSGERNGSRPRLVDEGRTLVLREEVRAPAGERQPEIRLVSNESTGGAQVQMAGFGLSPESTIAVACAWSRRSISLSDFTQGPRRNVASYDVDESIARMVRTGTDCRLALGGASVALPREMVPIVWPANP
jgi:hypothetical protein